MKTIKILGLLAVLFTAEVNAMWSYYEAAKERLQQYWGNNKEVVAQPEVLVQQEELIEPEVVIEPAVVVQPVLAQPEVVRQPDVLVQPEVVIEPEVVRQPGGLIKAKDFRSYRSVWEGDLADLSNNKNWDVDGFLTQEWIENAVEDAVGFIKDGDISVRQILDDLDDRLNELYKEKNSSTGKKMVASTFNRQLNVIDNFLVITPFKKALKAKITPELMSQVREQKQLKMQQLKMQQKKELERQKQRNRE